MPKDAKSAKKVFYHHPERKIEKAILESQEKAFVGSGWKPGRLPPGLGKSKEPTEAKKKNPKVSSTKPAEVPEDNSEEVEDGE